MPQAPLIHHQLPGHVAEEEDPAPAQGTGRHGPLRQGPAQPEPHQQEQQDEAQRRPHHVTQAGVEAIPGPRAEGDQIDRAGRDGHGQRKPGHRQ
ncbi:hypothetical protein D3C75_950490 [compost metagenome]